MYMFKAFKLRAFKLRAFRLGEFSRIALRFSASFLDSCSMFLYLALSVGMLVCWSVHPHIAYSSVISAVLDLIDLKLVRDLHNNLFLHNLFFILPVFPDNAILSESLDYGAGAICSRRCRQFLNSDLF
jgi:hypothetical protein